MEVLRSRKCIMERNRGNAGTANGYNRGFMKSKNFINPLANCKTQTYNSRQNLMKERAMEGRGSIHSPFLCAVRGDFAAPWFFCRIAVGGQFLRNFSWRKRLFLYGGQIQ